MLHDCFPAIRIELSRLHKLLNTYHSLIQQVKTREPDSVELLALAGILHSFYSGFENIFKRIMMDMDGSFKKTDSWHIDLLENMAIPNSKRGAVITEELKQQLQYYLSFRHVFRHHYSYDMNWSKMAGLIYDSEKLLDDVEHALCVFMGAEQAGDESLA